MTNLQKAIQRIEMYENSSLTNNYKASYSTSSVLSASLSLANLGLTSEDLAELMPRLAELKLKELDLSSNNLSILPEGIGLEKLTNLNLSNNPRIILSSLTRNLPYLEVLILDSSLSLKNLLALKRSMVLKQNPEDLFEFEELPKVYGLSRKLTDINGKFLDYLENDFMPIAEMYEDRSLNINVEDFATLFDLLDPNQKQNLINGNITLSNLVSDIEENNTPPARVMIENLHDLNELAAKPKSETQDSKVGLDSKTTISSKSIFKSKKIKH